jgi:hypothetical protein
MKIQPTFSDLSTEQEFAPGERAPRTGLYRVVHVGHRLSHKGLLLEGEKFPSCKHCDDGVRFFLYMRAQFLNTDYDFGGLPAKQVIPFRASKKQPKS